MNAAEQVAFATALLDPERPPPAFLATARGGDPARRFAIHRNNVVVSLIEALEARFPVCTTILGTEFFRATARAFLYERPPRSRILLHWGEEFPDFLRTFPPTAPFPWLPDLAALEAARGRAFHAADAEPIAPSALAALPRDRLPAVRVRLHPSVTLLRSRWAIVSLWAAHQEADRAAVEAALAELDLGKAEDALVHREGENVEVIALPPGVAPFLEALAAGRPLGEAAAGAADSDPRFDPAGALALILGRGLAVDLDDSGALR